MGCKPSKQRVEEFNQREQQVLTPPSKIMDASTHAQQLVQIIRQQISLQLGSKEMNLKATQMITQTFTNSDKPGMIYYVKCSTTNPEWPWIFVKIYEPPTITSVSPVKFRGLKKMKEEYKLVTF